MKIHCPAFNYGDRIPDRFTLDYENLSPPLKWDDVPEGTVEFALVCDDPDAPMGTWVHWVIYGIPGDLRELPEGLPKGPVVKNLGDAKQGRTGFGHMGYDGPRPPKGPDHRYFFRLYALSAEVDMGPGETATFLREKIENSKLAEAQTMGTYSR
ncbi:MAG TPA: YbhB/YbcL family Raf kinase inhibitor-like protein [Firmicutes bacterium]|nr:YbhB/YbcL family Raf kinase inhibitor-like protein [Bacillota bacterium]